MATYTMVIEDKSTTPGQPKYIFIDMKDPFMGDNTWSIKMPNNWIGVGSGVYKVVGWNHNVIEFRDGSWSGDMRMQFSNINYPDDCEPKSGAIKTGPGLYVSPYGYGGAARSLEWSGRNIVPDTWSDSDE